MIDWGYSLLFRGLTSRKNYFLQHQIFAEIVSHFCNNIFSREPDGKFMRWQQQWNESYVLHLSIFKYAFLNLLARSREGRGFRYEDINYSIRQLIDNRKPITEVAKYLSPTKFMFGWTKHLEIIVRIEASVFMVISFGQDGLEVQYSISKKELANRRENNRQVQCRSIKSDTLVLKRFINSRKDEPFKLFSWNCHSFANQLWDELLNNQRKS